MRFRGFYQLAITGGLLELLFTSPVLAEKVRHSEPLAVTCACPGRSRPLGKALTCEEACYGQAALEAFEKEAAADAQKKVDFERNLAQVAEQVQQANEDRLDAEAGLVVGLTENSLDASDDELLKNGTITNQKRRKAAVRVRDRAGGQ